MQPPYAWVQEICPDVTVTVKQLISVIHNLILQSREGAYVSQCPIAILTPL